MKPSGTITARFVGKLFTLATIALAATGCASIIKGSEQSVTLRSDPPEARLIITDVREGKDIHIGTTPFTTSLKRGAGYFTKAKYKVTIEKPGYGREEVLLAAVLFSPASCLLLHLRNIALKEKLSVLLLFVR